MTSMTTFGWDNIAMWLLSKAWVVAPIEAALRKQ